MTSHEERPNYAVRMLGISKQFGQVLANDCVNLEIERGTIHGLLGENGAGKTTLASILAGLISPDAGTIEINGKDVVLSSPSDAIKNGIGMVHQHFMLVETMSVVQNIALGLKREKWPLLDLSKLSSEIKAFGERIGLPVNPRERVSSLSVGLKQRAEILNALFRGAEILILDEPTAVLTSIEVEHLFSALRLLRAQKKSIVLISHKMSEILAITDEVTVLRRGKTVGSKITKETSGTELTEMMIGGGSLIEGSRTTIPSSKGLIEVDHLHVKDDRGVLKIVDLSFHIGGGEILGIAGVDGNGQRELADCLAGLRKAASGTIKLENLDITNRDASAMHRKGISYIPDDRLEAVVRDMTIAENFIIKDVGRAPYSDGRLLRPGSINRHAGEVVQEYSISALHTRLPAWTLSGGNIQRLLVARELRMHPKFLIACQPTRGLDLSATRFVHQNLRNLADSGSSLLLISSDLDELMELCDRIIVILSGRKTGEYSRREFSLREIGLKMTGAESLLA
ncbi:MAG TPA: ABC transporter ATP-binding protein [Nitrososphaerales archaeon]|nr:ABC transporter ATP-binding protein [Nitrososphaerales archaeon]